MHILDLTDPTQPQQVRVYVPDSSNSNVPPGLELKRVLGIAIQEPFASLASDREGFIRLDISDPTQPRLVAHFDFCPPSSSCDRVEDVVIQGDYAYVSGFRTDLRIFWIGFGASINCLTPITLSNVEYRRQQSTRVT